MTNNIVTSWILVLRPSCGSELTTKSDTRLIHDDTRSSISFHKRNWHNLVSLEKFSEEKIENSIGTRVDMELLFECSTRHLIHSLCSIVRYRGQHYVRDKKKKHHCPQLIRKALPFICQPDSGAKGKWRVSSWLAISITRKKITGIVHVWIYDFSQGRKSFLNIL